MEYPREKGSKQAKNAYALLMFHYVVSILLVWGSNGSRLRWNDCLDLIESISNNIEHSIS